MPAIAAESLMIRDAEGRLEPLIAEHPLPHLLVAPEDGRLLALNRAAADMLGFDRNDRLEPWPLEVEPQPSRRATDEVAGGRQLARLHARSGELIHAEVIERSVGWGSTHVLLLIVLGIAPTASRAARLVEQRRQSERMEAIGRLAGGVAHDLNNLLTVIRGHTDLISLQIDPAHEIAEDVGRIREAADRASDLARQLLAFARRQVLAPTVVDLNAAVERLRPVLESLLSSDQALVIGLDPATGSVRVDPSQLDQVLLNLALNGRDAMPDGGTLLIETASIDVDPAFARLYPPLQPGPHALLAVSDQGVGLTPDVREHLFEPFFTTKEGGRGTGLGLATVYGIVRQSRGVISVYSEPGLGTTMRIYLPKVAADPEHRREPQSAQATPSPQAVPVGPAATAVRAAAGARSRMANRTLLVVDDEPEVRQLLEAILRRAGHRILTAPHAAAALAAVRAQTGRIDGLVTDVVMPGLTGPELAEQLRGEQPDLRVLFISGLVEDTFLDREELPAATAFLAKPFSPDRLLAAVEALFGDTDAAGDAR
ncbi:MAG TPA: response regulator [Candidatus Limnocylindrales bacterium]|nr:response regulator [Candidatus Limnocylindrales bacterium]